MIRQRQELEQTIPLYLFAKPPRVGVSKTRLASGVGAENAAAFARAFVQDTWARLLTIPWGLPVLATTDINADFGLPTGDRMNQGGGDLGDRLARVLGAGIASAGAAFAVGADSPGMPAAHFDAARAALEQHDAAFVSTDDGGFALLALRRCPEDLFTGIPWSTAHTLTALRARMQALGMSHRSVARWFDIDHAADLEQFRAEVSPSDAPRTWAAMRRAELGPTG